MSDRSNFRPMPNPYETRARLYRERFTLGIVFDIKAGFTVDAMTATEEDADELFEDVVMVSGLDPDIVNARLHIRVDNLA